MEEIDWENIAQKRNVAGTNVSLPSSHTGIEAHLEGEKVRVALDEDGGVNSQVANFWDSWKNVQEL